MEYPCIHLPSLTRLPILQNSNHVLNRLSVSHTEQLAQSPIKFRQEVIAVMQIIVKSGASVYEGNDSCSHGISRICGKSVTTQNL